MDMKRIRNYLVDKVCCLYVEIKSRNHIDMINRCISSIPQFHKDPLSSTHRLLTRTTPLQHQNPLVLNQNPSFPQPPSVQHPKFISSTPKTPQFHTPSVPHRSMLHAF